MLSEASPEASFQAASDLLRHLRHHPADANDPKALAERFGLPESLVTAVVMGARRPDPVPQTVLTRRLTMDGPRRVARQLRDASRRLTSRPIPYLILTAVLGTSATILFERLEPPKTPGVLGPLSIYDLLSILALLLAVIAQGILFYRRGMARLPVYAGLVNWITVISVTMASLLLKPGSKSVVEYVGIAFVLAFASAFPVLVAMGGGVVLALLGAYARTRSVDMEEEAMSRADLLDRYFDLQKRLEKGDTQQRVADWLESSLFARLFRRGVWPVALVANFSIEAVTLFATVVSKWLGGDSLGPLAIVLMVLSFGLLCARFVLWITVGLFAGSIGRAMAVMGGIALTGYLIHFIPIPTIGVTALDFLTMAGALFYMFVSFVLAGFSALAADVQRHNARDRRLAGNDPALLMAEMLRIQWKLAEATSNVCVLVVDAAKSAQMKAEADPLTAEYSFREYQEWLAEIVAEFGGKVTATVGDGAIFEFNECAIAFKAARRIHTDLDRFNREINRLASPFRLRIGIHIGQVVGDINEVQFTEVIDIAAHVQGAAPIGGIAVTGPVASCLPEERFIPLAEPIDNHPVLIAVESME